MPAVPEHDYGPEVCLGPDALDLPGFLALAARFGGGVLYLRASPFDPGRDDDQPDSPPAYLLGHKGNIGQVGAAFAAGGLVHFWEHQAAWYREWQELPGSQPSRRDSDLDDEDGPGRLSDEERAQLVSELASTIVADPRFRAAPRSDRQALARQALARQALARQALARQALPKGTDRWVSWDAVREACARAHEMAQARYDQLTEQLDDLAAELLASPEYQQASSAPARKHAAGRFLIPRADGFSPPTTLVREELYARAQRLAKAAKPPAGGLF